MELEHYNLIDEPWIKVVALDGSERVYGLKELFTRAHELSFLAGETELQNVAVLRMLVAISVTSMYRYDSRGNRLDITNRREAISRYKELWNQQKFTDEMTTYLNTWHARFDLLDEEYPFYQVPGKYRKRMEGKPDSKNKAGITYLLDPYGDSDKLGWVGATGFNGEILQSGNTVSPFSTKSGLSGYSMTFAESARWLIYYMSFADCASKIPGKWNAGMTFASSGALIRPAGKNLFETVMLCSVLLDQNERIYPKVSPAWEHESYTRINALPYGETMPNNLPELYTQQARKVIIHRVENRVDGIYVAAGDRYGIVNSFIEPMFAFRVDRTDKSGNTLKPKHFYENEMGWKNFEAILGSVEKCYSKPSRWIDILFDEEVLPDEANIPYIMTDIGYGNMSCGVTYTINTSVVINKKYFKDSSLLRDAKVEAERISKISGFIRQLGIDIDLAYGAKKNKNGGLETSVGEELQKEYERAIGNEFLLFLENKMQIIDIRKKEVDLAEKTVSNILKNINLLGYIGHGEECTVGKAEVVFYNKLMGVKKELGLTGGEKRE